MLPNRSRRFALANTIAWSTYGAISVAMGRAFAGGISSGFVLIAVGLAVLLWVASGVLRAVALRRGWLECDGGAMALRLAVAVALLAAAVQAALAAILAPALSLGWVELPGNAAPYSLGAAFGYWVNTVMVLALWTGVWVGWRLLRRARESEIAALRAQSERHAMELEALRARLNPHFVFNALNNLRALILEDPARAREMVTRLSSTLRHALEHSQREWTTLGEEVAVVRDYLDVEQVHYESRLRPRIDVPESLSNARLPPMALQLLVENAIKHGIARTPGGGEVGVEASMRDGLLCLRVGNPGCLGDGEPGGAGVGHAFLRERVGRAGGRFALHEEAGRVVASLEIPQ